MKESNKYSDTDLQMLIHGKDKAEFAFNVIFDKYAKRFRAYCIFITSDKYSAEELFEESFIKVFSVIQKGTIISNIFSYLISIASNINKNNYRERQQKKKINLMYTDDESMLEQISSDNHSINFENQDFIEKIKSLTEFLNENYREAFILHYITGLSYTEISEKLDISADNAKMRCHRAMQEIIKLVKIYYSDDIKQRGI